MQHLEPKDFPQDFFYHRKASPGYRKYLAGCGPIPFDIAPPQFAWGKNILGNWGVVNYERTDVEPDIEDIKKRFGMKHGMINWVPYHMQQHDKPPVGWRKLWLKTHFEETGYSLLDTPEYWKKWNDRAKRARKKFLASGARIEIIPAERFAEAFLSAKVKHHYKKDYVKYFRKLVAVDPESVRQWVVYDSSDTIVAGLAVHDFLGTHSVHLVAFTTKEGYPLQAGTGLIDIWFADSLTKGIKYLSFDQLRQKWGPRDQRGYTEFKENFIEYRMSFPKAYFKIF